MSDVRKAFPERFGYRKDVLTWDSAPVGFRHAVVGIAQDEHLLVYDQVVLTVQSALGLPRPPRQSWSNLHRSEATELIEGCEWWDVFTVAEAIYNRLQRQFPALASANQYQAAINEYCVAHGIGWRMVQGQFERRGPDIEDDQLRSAEEALRVANKETSANELQKAISDLSKRPDPDVTGAVQHVGAAIECLARDLCGDPSLTLGEIIKRHKHLFPGAYRKLADAIWGIASTKGRHLEEGGEPTVHEAMLLVGVVAPLCSFLLQHQNKQ